MYESRFVKAMNMLQDPLFLFMRLFWGFKIFRAGCVKLGDLSATVDQFSAMGIKTPMLLAILVGGIEAVGGLGLFLGVGTRYWALLLAIIMGSAYVFEHPEALAGFSHMPLVDALDNFMRPYHFLFLFPMIILLVCGSGKYSLEWLWFHRTTRPKERSTAIV